MVGLFEFSMRMPFLATRFSCKKPTVNATALADYSNTRQTSYVLEQLSIQANGMQ
jgi:hypothetical protein